MLRIRNEKQQFKYGKNEMTKEQEEFKLHIVKNNFNSTISSPSSKKRFSNQTDKTKKITAPQIYKK